MKLTPNTVGIAGMEYEYGIYPSKTYALNAEKGRIAGCVDGLEAVRQAAAKALQTERFRHPVYSANYGAELMDKLGMPVSLALPEIRRCITEALTWDSRIESVDGFEFDVQGRDVHVCFTVHSIYGDYSDETEVSI